MTEKQFNQLRVGDMVMNRTLTKEVPVIDINRKNGLINTGGSWRRHKDVRMAGVTVEEPTVLAPVTHITFSVKSLKRYPILDMVILKTILRAGPGGFIGTSASLCEATQICKSQSVFKKIIFIMDRDKIIVREPLPLKLTRFTVNMDKAKDYLL